MSIDEIIVKLKDRMVQHKTSIRKAFQSYDPSGKGKIKKKDFRQVKFKLFKITKCVLLPIFKRKVSYVVSIPYR